MRYALLIHRRPDDDAGMTDGERQALSAEYYALRDDPRVVGGAPLHPPESATLVRCQDGQTLITDGPFADTKEVFGGWYLVETSNLDGALDVAAKIPAVRLGGTVEVRPVMEGPH